MNLVLEVSDRDGSVIEALAASENKTVTELFAPWTRDLVWNKAGARESLTSEQVASIVEGLLAKATPVATEGAV